MGFSWKIELSRNEIMLLMACAEYDKGYKKLPAGEETPGSKRQHAEHELWKRTVNEKAGRSIKALSVVSRGLQNEGLTEPGGWRLTPKGKLVLQLLQQDMQQF